MRRFVLIASLMVPIALAGCSSDPTKGDGDGSVKDGNNAGTDSNNAGTDGTNPGTDGTNPGTDGTKPGTDGTKPGTDGTKPTTDGTKPTTDGTKPTTDGTNPTVDGPNLGDAWPPPGDHGVLVGDGGATGGTIPCNGKIYECGDGIDNDNDGKRDLADPDCISPCDDDESSLATGIPGDNKDPCNQDCFFDGNSGQGDDHCQWNLKCDKKNPAKALGGLYAKLCQYDAKYKNCPKAQSQQCIDKCRKLAPNGCDCFGCCEIYSNGTSYTVFLNSGGTCSVSTPQNCAQCTQATSCLNTCGRCELCLGKTINDLPSDCFPKQDGGSVIVTDSGQTIPVDSGITTSDSGVVTKGDGTVQISDGGLIILPSCEGGESPCLTTSNCPSGYYCLTGCCKPPIQ